MNINMIYDAETGVEHKVEMPRINDLYHGQQYCFFWAIGQAIDDDSTVMRVIKVNRCDGSAGDGTASAQSWWRVAHYPTEPIFVPDPQGLAEDDGVIVTSVLDGERQQTYLLVLNATDMSTLATAYTPVISPYDVHGQFFEDQPVTK